MAPSIAVLLFLAALVAVPPVVRYLVAPWRVRATQRLSSRRPLRLVPDGEVPSFVRKFVVDEGELLAPLGFQPGPFLAYGTPTATIFFGHFRHPHTHDTAIAAVTLLTRGGTPRLSMPYLEFSTTFTDDRAVNTSTSSRGAVFPRFPEMRNLRAPEVRDRPQLYALHRLRVAEEGGDPRPLVPGREIERIEQSMARQNARLVTAGWYEPLPGTDALRPTVKGAHLMTWKLLFPLKQLAEARRRREVRRLLARLGPEPLPA